MRIGTWNVEGRRTSAHTEFLMALDCDVLLLTEVNDGLDLPGFHVHRTSITYASHRTWSAVATRTPLVPLPDPHPATAMANWEGWTLASSVLPWRGCGLDPWGEGATRK